jgi:hypothetical protein
MKVELRFIEFFYELNVLERYLESFEEQLPVIAQQEEQKTYLRLRDETDLAVEDEAFRELEYLNEEVLPRFFRGAILVTLWAIFESALTDIATEIRDQQSQTLTLRDIRGDFLERVKKYFNHVLNFPLKTNDKNWISIRMLKVLRNALARGNGQIENINDIEKRKIKNWERNEIGLSISSFGYLLFSEQFVRRIFSAVQEILNDLTNRVFEQYPNP